MIHFNKIPIGVYFDQTYIWYFFHHMWCVPCKIQIDVYLQGSTCHLLYLYITWHYKRSCMGLSRKKAAISMYRNNCIIKWRDIASHRYAIYVFMYRCNKRLNLISVHFKHALWVIILLYLPIILQKWTRNTPRAQTFIVPNMRNVKQSSQAWNSLPPNVPVYFLFHAGPILNSSRVFWNFADRHTDRQTDIPRKIKTLLSPLGGGKYRYLYINSVWS